MAELKTQRNDASVEAFLETVDDKKKRDDAFALLRLMQEIAGTEPAMWGETIVGFGSVPLKYASGRTLDWFPVGFSPRKQNLTLYLLTGFEGHEDLLARLGKHSLGKSCLYVKKLADIDLDVLRALVKRALDEAAKIRTP